MFIWTLPSPGTFLTLTTASVLLLFLLICLLHFEFIFLCNPLSGEMCFIYIEETTHLSIVELWPYICILYHLYRSFPAFVLTLSSLMHSLLFKLPVLNFMQISCNIQIIIDCRL